MNSSILQCHVKRLLFLAILASISISLRAAENSVPKSLIPPSSAEVATRYGQLPLSFEANQGQADKRVRFVSRGNGYSLLLTDASAILALTQPVPTSPMNAHPGKSQAASITRANARSAEVIQMELHGANRNSEVPRRIQGENQLAGVTNYFIGNDPANWHADVPTYARVRYAQVYPGVDLVFYGNQSQLEYDFIVGAGADPSPIQLRFDGASRLKLNNCGDLEIHTRNGKIALRKPVLYQQQSGTRRQVSGHFTLLAGNTVGFTIGSYDRSQSLVIDPLLEYSTFLGGSNDDYATAIAVDAEGSAYVTGLTSSVDFPVTSGVFQKTSKSVQLSGTTFVSKLNPAGTALIYSTFLGGTGLEAGQADFGDMSAAIAVDKAGEAYIVGAAYSKDFPVTANAFQKTQRAAASQYPNAFLSKLSSNGASLLYSTYLGGSYNDRATSVAVDDDENAYVAGASGSANFPTTKSAFQTRNPSASRYGVAAFVAKFNPTLGTLIYSTLLGGGDSPNQFAPSDGAYGIAVDGAGSAYVTGSATSTNFPVTSEALQPKNRGASLQASNAFITKLNPEGSALIYSTYIGGTGSDTRFKGLGEIGYGIAIDKEGDAYITGESYSPNFPVTANAFQKKNPGYSRTSSNAFVAKLNPTGSDLVYATYLGGSGIYNAFYDVYWGETGHAIAVDSAGNAYVTGDALSPDFPATPGAFQPKNKAAAVTGSNGFITKLDATGSKLVYSSYFGGSSYDTVAGLALDSAGNAYITGLTVSRNFPVTKNSLQIAPHSPAGYSSAFITRLNLASGIQGRTPISNPVTSIHVY